jgi:hypothetical protein
MSWSVSTKLRHGWADEDVSVLRLRALEQNPECSDQFDAAVQAILMLLESGAVGDARKEFFVAMGGHANPGHEPRSGWANDLITISISQASPVKNRRKK